MSGRARVVIIGGGFGGLSAARALKSAPVEVTLLDRRNYHLFQPLLYQVATGSLSPGEIAAPLRGVLSHQKNTRVLLGEVQDIDPVLKRVLLADGANFEYDFLIVASGSQTSYYGHDSWRKHAPSLKSVEDATSIRNRIFSAFEMAERISDPAERRSWLTFVIVGAGATGVELAGAIAEIAKQTLRHDFRSIHPEEAQIIVIDGASRALPPFPEDLAQKAVDSLGKLGVQIKTGHIVNEIDESGLTFQGQDGMDRLDAKTIIWAGGVTVSALGKTLAQRTQTETDKGGRIKVGPQLNILGYPEIYVIGDLALFIGTDGKPLPGVAQVAMQEGTYAAHSILRKIQGRKELERFKYFDKGNLAVIGRWAAIADVFGIHLSGRPAWLVWVFIHLMYIVLFQSRIIVFIHWAFQDLTFSRGARLITGNAEFKKEMSSRAKGAS